MLTWYGYGRHVLPTLLEENMELFSTDTLTLPDCEHPLDISVSSIQDKFHWNRENNGTKII